MTNTPRIKQGFQQPFEFSISKRMAQRIPHQAEIIGLDLKIVNNEDHRSIQFIELNGIFSGVTAYESLFTSDQEEKCDLKFLFYKKLSELGVPLVWLDHWKDCHLLTTRQEWVEEGLDKPAWLKVGGSVVPYSDYYKNRISKSKIPSELIRFLTMDIEASESKASSTQYKLNALHCVLNNSALFPEQIHREIQSILESTHDKESLTNEFFRDIYNKIKVHIWDKIGDGFKQAIKRPNIQESTPFLPDCITLNPLLDRLPSHPNWMDLMNTSGRIMADKALMHEIFQTVCPAYYPTSKLISRHEQQNANKLIEELAINPDRVENVIIKPIHESGGRGVLVVPLQQLQAALDAIRSSDYPNPAGEIISEQDLSDYRKGVYGDRLLLQEYIKNSEYVSKKSGLHYDPTMRLYIACIRTGQKASLYSMDAFWKLPPESIDNNTKLSLQSISNVYEGEAVAVVDDNDFNLVKQEIIKIFPDIYAEIGKQSLKLYTL